MPPERSQMDEHPADMERVTCAEGERGGRAMDRRMDAG